MPSPQTPHRPFCPKGETVMASFEADVLHAFEGFLDVALLRARPSRPRGFWNQWPRCPCVGLNGLPNTGSTGNTGKNAKGTGEHSSELLGSPACPVARFRGYKFNPGLWQRQAEPVEGTEAGAGAMALVFGVGLKGHRGNHRKSQRQAPKARFIEAWNLE